MTELQFHPAADAFPMFDKKRHAELVEDIREHGQLEPITLCDGMILDGRNRYRACVDLGIDPATRIHEGDPWAFAWSLNGQRRDLVADQRYLIWKFCHEKSEGWQAQKRAIAEAANRARSEAAKERERTEAGTYQPVREQSVPAVESPRPGKTAKSMASQTNAGAVARGDKLAKERPDLAQKVMRGEIKSAEAHREMKRDVVAKTINPPSGKYRVIYADPPWSYGNTQPDYHTEQRDHYPVMKMSDICALPIADMAEPDAVLFLWVTSPILEESFQVVKAWGFKYKSSFVWDKIKHNMGHYNSVRHEMLLICTRGSCQPDVRKLFDSVQSIERTEHSRKPDEFRHIIDTIYPHGKRVELFARSKAENWEAWGNQA